MRLPIPKPSDFPSAGQPLRVLSLSGLARALDGREEKRVHLAQPLEFPRVSIEFYTPDSFTPRVLHIEFLV